MWDKPDICIVGSGAAGSFLVKELSDSELSILIIETGGETLDSDSSKFIDKFDIKKTHKLNYGFSRQLGGSTNLWAGRVCPLESSDFDAKNDSGGWPISFSELIQHYDKAADHMNVPTYDYFKEPAAPANAIGWMKGLFQSNVISIKKFIWSTPPYNTHTNILNNLLNNSKKISIRSGCHVTQLFENERCDKIEAVEFIDRDNKKHKIYPKHVVLCAGGIENARLLLNSINQQKHGIGNKHDVVGRYFSTHPKADMGVVILNKPVAVDKNPLFSDTNEGGVSIRHGIGLQEKYIKNNSILNHYIQLTPLLEYTASTFFEKTKNSSVLNSSLINKSKVLQGFLPGIGLVLYELIGRISKMQRKTKKFIVRAFLDQYPHPDNRIALSDTLDKYGFPKANIHWEFKDQDKESVLKSFELINDNLRDNGIGHMEYSKLKEIDHWPMIAIHSHFMGSTRMGDDPKTSVVDKDCKAHGYSNLFIAGPSVFPTYGYANPVFTIAAISFRLGAQIKALYGQDHKNQI